MSGFTVFKIIVVHLVEELLQVARVRLHVEQRRIGASRPHFGANRLQAAKRGGRRKMKKLEISSITTHTQSGGSHCLLPAVNLLISIVAQTYGDVLIVLVRLGNQLGHTEACQLTAGHPRRQRFAGHRHHGRARPQHIHAGGVAVAQWRVQANVHQLAAADVLLLGRHIREDDATGRQAIAFGQRQHIRLARGREAQKPDDAIWDSFENLK